MKYPLNDDDDNDDCSFICFFLVALEKLRWAQTPAAHLKGN